MEINVFLQELKKSLVLRGINEDTAKRYTSLMTSSMSSSQRKQIENYNDPSDFASLSDNLAAAIKSKEHKKPSATSGKEDVKIAPHEKKATNASQKTNEANLKQETTTINRRNIRHIQPKQEPAPSPAPQPSNEKKNRLDASKEDPLIIGPKGKQIFIICLILLSPLLLALVAAYFVFFGIQFVAVALLIAVFIVGLIVGCSAGGAFALAAIIYGVIHYFSVPVEGKYEFGLGLLVAGCALLLGTLFYFIALKWLPKLFPLIKRFFNFSSKKLIALFLYLRKECYKL